MRQIRSGLTLVALSFAATTAITTTTTDAEANIESVALFDARAAAMGDTGVANVRNAGAVYHNPAELDAIHTTSIGVGFILDVPGTNTARVPLDGPGKEVSGNVQSTTLPAFDLGYRIMDRLVLGVGAYPLAYFGGSFRNVKSLGGRDIIATSAIAEFSPALSFAVTDKLSLGLGYRITYLTQSFETPTKFFGQTIPVRTELSGLSYAGIQAGIYYRPLDIIHVGLTYRNKITVHEEGDTFLIGTGRDGFKTTQDFSLPHRFKLGVAYSLLQHRLNISTDVKLNLYKESNKETVAKVDAPTGPITQRTDLSWMNSVGLGIGAEYAVHPKLDVRAGYSLSSSATPTKTAGYFVPPPAPLNGIHAGLGTHIPNVDFDLSGVYTFSSTYTKPPTANPGTYTEGGLYVTFSCTYHN